MTHDVGTLKRRRMDIGKVAQDIMREVEGLFAATAALDDVRVATEGVQRVLSAIPEQGALDNRRNEARPRRDIPVRGDSYWEHGNR